MQEMTGKQSERLQENRRTLVSYSMGDSRTAGVPARKAPARPYRPGSAYCSSRVERAAWMGLAVAELRAVREFEPDDAGDNDEEPGGFGFGERLVEEDGAEDG